MKINLGNSEHKKSFFPISLDSSTTANFGECLPIFSHELVPGSHASINIRDAVRFAPLSFPTFGKAFLKTYAFSHKISDLYPPFNDMLAQTPYVPPIGDSYIPSSVPNVPLYVLWLSVLSNCDFTFYTSDFSGIDLFEDGDNPFVVSSIPYDKVTEVKPTNGALPLSHEDLSLNLTYWLERALYSGHADLPELVQFDDFVHARYYNEKASNIGTVYVNGEVDSLGEIQLPAVTPGSADYIFYLPKEVLGYYIWNGGDIQFKQYYVNFLSSSSGSQTKSDNVIVCMRLNDSGKFLRKLFMGLGYQIAPLDTPVSVLPLYAYFKSYFDTFAPKRFVKFEQTYFYRAINYCVNFGVPLSDILNRTDVGFSWDTILDDLLSCYYTKDTDYFSAQIIGLINDFGNSLSQKYLGVYDNPDSGNLEVESDVLSSNQKQGAVPSINFKDTQMSMNHTQNQQNILSRLTQFVNRRSVIGSKIASLLKSVFGISPKEIDEYNSYIGSSTIDVNFSDVFSTAETSEGSLGEYAGKAMAFGNGDTFNINVDTHSIILAFSVVVPRTQYVQGVNPILTHVSHDSFYNPMFDGLTLLPTRKSALYTGNGFLSYYDGKKSFGNLPIYSEYKTKVCGILSGDLSLNSTRATYDSFTMDELISSDTRVTESDNSIYAGTYDNISYDFNGLVCGTMWRYLGRWLWLGRFDRIFVNNRVDYNDFLNSILPSSVDGNIQSSRSLVRTDDNLIIHHVVDLKINAPMVPLSGSFMTDDLLALDKFGVNAQGE